MFTGLVETVGTVRDFRRTGSVYLLSIGSPVLAPTLALGQSMAGRQIGRASCRERV